MSHPSTTVKADKDSIKRLIATAQTREGFDTIDVDGLQMLADHYGIAVDLHSPGTPDLTWQQAVGDIRQAVAASAR